MEEMFVKTNEFFRCDVPVFNLLTKHQGLDVSRTILLQFIDSETLTDMVVEEFWIDCIQDWLMFGGTLPKESLIDWLYFRGLIRSV